MRICSSFLAMGLALVAFAWTGQGESCIPQLKVTELPLKIVNDCDSHASCHGAQQFTSHWVGRTVTGDLFLVRRTPCDAGGCVAWFIERTPGGVATRLSMEGSFRISIGNSPYPDVQTQRALSDMQTIYTNFSWVGDRYRQMSTRKVYRVAGIECVSKGDCYRMGLKELREGHTSQALDIWQKVNHLSWI